MASSQVPNPTGSDTPIDSPLGALDTTQYSYSSFIYPLNLGTEGAGNDHYMVFHINETSNTQFNTRVVNDANPTDLPTINQNQLNTTNSVGGGASFVNSKGQVSSFAPSGPSGTTANAPALTHITAPVNRVATTIVLYMPQDIQSSYQAEWESADLGAAAAFSSKLFGEGSWSDIMKSLGASALKNGGQMLNEFTGLELSNAISASTGFAINPHKEVIFNGIGFRQFSFKFRFTPTSEDEAANVDNIIRAFKFYAAPEIKTGSAGRFWIYPAEFDIQYYANGVENLFLNKISTCALTDINVNYTGTGHWAAHRPHSKIQGNPSVCTDISLTFKELEIMTKRRVLDGY